MNLTFLGTGSANNPVLNNTSAYAIFDDTLLLLDCGETVFKSIYENNLLDGINNLFIVITHFHSDHFGSMGSMLYYSSCILKKKVFLYFPSAEICSLLKLTGVPESMYEYCSEVPAGMPFNLAPLEVVHDPMIKCYGYYISDHKETIFYGGDSSTIPEDTLVKLRKGIISHVYQDTTYEFSSTTQAHGSLEQLDKTIEPELRSKITCMHFASDFTESVKKLGFIPAHAEVR